MFTYPHVHNTFVFS